MGAVIPSIFAKLSMSMYQLTGTPSAHQTLGTNSDGTAWALRTPGWLDTAQTWAALQSFSTGVALSPVAVGAGSFDDDNGDEIDFAASGVKGRWNLSLGSTSAPITGVSPCLTIHRTEDIDVADLVNHSTNEQNSGIVVKSSNLATSEAQCVAATFVAQSKSTQSGQNDDACGLLCFGRIVGSGTGYGIGAYVEGRRDTTTGNANGLEVRCANYTGTDGTYNPNGVSNTMGIWLTASGDSDSGVAIDVGAIGGHQWDVGLGFPYLGWSPVKTTSIRDDSHSTTSYVLRGEHSIGIDTTSGVFTSAEIRLAGSLTNPALATAMMIGSQITTSANSNSLLYLSGGIIPSATLSSSFGANITPVVGSADANSNTVTVFSALYSRGASGAGYTGTITQARAIDVGDFSKGNGSATVTNLYGVYVQPQTAGASNYGVYIGSASTQTLWVGGDANNTTAAAGVSFGSSRDTNLYRAAANLLQTDDDLAALSFTGTGTGTSSFVLYNSTDRTTDYERINIRWASNVATIGTQFGAGATARTLRLEAIGTGGATTYWLNLQRNTAPFFSGAASTGGTTGIWNQFIGTSTGSSSTTTFLSVSPTVNQTSTAAYTGLSVSITETATGSGAKKLLDLAAGSSPTTKFSVTNTGLMAGSGFADARVATNVTVASTTPVNVTGLSFAIGASEVWTATFYLTVTGATNGCQFQVTGPASPTDLRITSFGNTTGVTAVSADSVTAFSTLSGTYANGAFTGVMRITVSINNGANAGTVQLQFATASGTNTCTVLANSYMRAKRVS